MELEDIAIKMNQIEGQREKEIKICNLIISRLLCYKLSIQGKICQ